jgi:hypothetical protein
MGVAMQHPTAASQPAYGAPSSMTALQKIAHSDMILDM